MNQKPAFNPALPIIHPSWKGNPVANGQYQNLDGASTRTWSEVWQWMRSKNNLKALKKHQQTSLINDIFSDSAPSVEPVIVPLGHAGFIIEVNGLRIVIDPVLTTNPFLKRYTKVPINPLQLVNVNYLLLSHNHRDHIDKTTVKLLTKANPQCKILTGLETGKLLRKWNIKNEIEEAGWFQRFNTTEGLLIDYLPAKHWSRRWLTDTNINLWGSYMIQTAIQNKCIYFGADSGYGQHFSMIGELYPRIDYALLGIGAYEPVWFMNTAHTGPEAALKAFHDLQAHTLIPMHYGTFDLSDEPIFYPEQVLKTLNQTHNVNINWMKIGRKMEI